MKRKLLNLSVMLVLLLFSTITANAAGFVPIQNGSTICKYYTDESNTQYYADGFITIDGKLYGFTKDGLTNISQTFDISDPEIMKIYSSYPPVIMSTDSNPIENKNVDNIYPPIVLKNGIILDTTPVTTKDGTFQFTSGKSTVMAGLGWTKVSVKYNYQPGTRGTVCYVSMYDSDGFEVATSSVSASQIGENTDYFSFPNKDVVRIAFKQSNY